MNEILSNGNQNQSMLVKSILLAGLLVGTLDITAAIIQTLVNGRNPINMLKFIASGVFGKSAFSAGNEVAAYGLFFHYCIAFVWSANLFLLYPKLNFIKANWVIIGIGYGCFVWGVMNWVVLPLSNTPPLPFKFSGAVIAVLILIGAIGIPLAFMANRFYKTIDN